MDTPWAQPTARPRIVAKITSMKCSLGFSGRKHDNSDEEDEVDDEEDLESEDDVAAAVTPSSAGNA